MILHHLLVTFSTCEYIHS